MRRLLVTLGHPLPRRVERAAAAVPLVAMLLGALSSLQFAPVDAALAAVGQGDRTAFQHGMVLIAFLSVIVGAVRDYAVDWRTARFGRPAEAMKARAALDYSATRLKLTALFLLFLTPLLAIGLLWWLI